MEEEKILKVDAKRQLEELQALVKGYIEVVPCTENGCNNDC